MSIGILSLVVIMVLLYLHINSTAKNEQIQVWDLRKLAVDVCASSVEGGYTAQKACDNCLNTRWSSQWSDPQWICIDMGKIYEITQIRLVWEAAYAREYKLEVSNNARTWRQIKHITNGKGGEESFDFKEVTARYVRLYGIKRATQWGYSLYEFAVYGPQEGKEPNYGGLVVPLNPVTVYDHNIVKLDSFLTKRLSEDPPNSKRLSDDEFLDLIQRRTFDYFWYEVSPDTFYVADSTTWKTHTSIAGIGFQLGAYIVGHYRRYRPPKEIYQRVEKLLDNCWDDPDDPDDLCLEHHEGWPYHWLNIKTGKWEGHEHVCTHDCIMYLCGVIAAKHYFAGTKAGDIAAKILDSVDWKWIIHGGFNKRLISNCYARTYDPPCGGEVIFYDGMKFDYLLPIGGIKSSIPPRYWHNYAQTFPWDSYKGHFFRIERPAIWIHQWDNCWFDFRYMKDDYADYFQNSVEATLANREWCIDNNSYSENLWGIGPSFGPSEDGGFFYKSYGAPPDNLPFQKGQDNDFTIAPYAAIGSIIFTPQESIKVARFIYDNYKDKIWKRYGFTDSLNPKKDWFCQDYIAIDQGPIILNIENYRSGLLWKYFSKEKVVWNGLNRCDFVGIIDNFDESEHSLPYGKWYDIDKGRFYEYRKSDDYVKEGRFALKVDYNLGRRRDKYFAVKPSRSDFSPYKYLAFWVRGDEDFFIELIARDRMIIVPVRKTILLKEKSKIRSFDGWFRYYFELPEDKDILRKVKEIRFFVKSQEKEEGSFYLDDIVLTNHIRTTEPNLMIDDFEDSDAPKSLWTTVNNNCYKITVTSDRAHDGKRSLKIDFDKKEIEDRWSYIKAKVGFNDWRRCHSVSMWVYGKAEILLKLTDGKGKTYEVEAQRAIEEDDWSHLFFNIQANLDPNNCWQLRYDKKDIREMLIYIEPGRTDKKGTIYLDSIMLTE